MATVSITAQGDGWLRKSGATWAEVARVTTADTAYQAAGTTNMTIQSSKTGSTPAWRIDRYFASFDLSAYQGTLNSAALKLYVTNKNDMPGDTVIHVVPASQASATTLATSDYDNLTFSSKGSKTISSITTSASNSWTVTTGVTLGQVNKFAVITSCDLTNTETAGGTGNTEIQHNSSSAASNKAVLEIDYIPRAKVLYYQQI